MKTNVSSELKKKHYGLFGNAGTEVCLWTKKALRNEDVCYKQKFYGIPCHRCMQFSPLIACNQNCLFCWRPTEIMHSGKISGKIEEPEKIIENLIEERRKLLTGFGANKKNRKKWQEALKPSHFAISLMGEPTLYPKLPELMSLLKQRPETKTIFIVSNGQNPEMLLKLKKKNALPTQMYLSMNAPGEKLFREICRPCSDRAWKIYLKSLKILKSLRCRKVIRMTIIKGLNDNYEFLPEYARLIRLAEPDFVEVKAYMRLGYNRQSFLWENMPSLKDIEKFSEKLLKELKNFKKADKNRLSRIVLLKNKKTKFRQKIFD